MQQLLKLETSFETVGYEQDSNVPELCGYGEHIPVIVTLNEPGNLETMFITIGDKQFLPSQIETLVSMINRVKSASNSFK